MDSTSILIKYFEINFLDNIFDHYCHISFIYSLKPEQIEIVYSNNVLVCIDGCDLYNFLALARKYAVYGHRMFFV